MKADLDPGRTTRDGFDLTRHPASLLANGEYGWVRTTNFVVAGLLTLAAAVGLRGTLTGRGRTWAPRLLAAYGVGLLLAAAFPADPHPVSRSAPRPTTPRSARAASGTSSPGPSASPA